MEAKPQAETEAQKDQLEDQQQEGQE